MEILSIHGIRQSRRRRGRIRFSSVNAIDGKENLEKEGYSAVIKSDLPNEVSVGTSFCFTWSWAKSVNKCAG